MQLEYPFPNPGKTLTTTYTDALYVVINDSSMLPGAQTSRVFAIMLMVDVACGRIPANEAAVTAAKSFVNGAVSSLVTF